MPTQAKTAIATTMIDGEPYMKMADLALWASTSFNQPVESIDPQKFAIMLNAWRISIMEQKAKLKENGYLDLSGNGDADA